MSIETKVIATHTPGPWRLDDCSAQYGNEHRLEHISSTYHYIDSDRCFLDKETNTGFSISGYLTLADATLITAAPDLFKAANEVLDAYETASVHELCGLPAPLLKALGSLAAATVKAQIK